MGKPSTKFKHWGKDNKSSSTENTSNTTTENQNQADQNEHLLWNYVAFQPSNDPKHKNGTKLTTLRPKRLQSSQSTTSKQHNQLKKRPTATLTLGRDNDDSRMKRVRRSHIDDLPLLRDPFQLKYVLEGHSCFPEHSATNRRKKSSNNKSKGKKKESSSNRRGRRQSQKNGDSEVDDDDSDNDMDDSLDIWACEFEPSADTTPSTTVALCGGSSILFLDTQQGRYVKKYTHPEPLECFYTLAWTLLHGSQQLGRNTTVNGSDDDDDDGDSDSQVNNNSTNDEDEDEDEDTFAAILAAAGKFGSIKLLEPTQTQCYRYLFGHQQPVLKLGFAKKEPRWLLSSSMDMTVRLWDIGTPSSETDDSSCLAHFTVPGTSHPTSMSLSYDLSLLVVGTHQADLLQYKVDKSRVKKWHHDTYEKVPNTRNKTKPSPILIKPKVKFSHGEEWHEGYVEDVYILGQDGVESDIADYVVSRGSDDMEVLMWNPKTSTKSDADIHLSLEWPESDDCTGMRFSIVEMDGQKLLLGGDNDGDVRLFNIGDGKFSKTLKDGSKELFDPVKVFSNDASTHLIRDVCISSDTRKFVAVDSNNTVFVWSCN